MRRIAGALAGAVIAVGVSVGATAWAHPGPTQRHAVRACIADARAANPDADRRALREAARPCLEALGLPARPRTPEQRAAREAVRACVRDVRQTHPDAGRHELRELVRECLPG